MNIKCFKQGCNPSCCSLRPLLVYKDETPKFSNLGHSKKKLFLKILLNSNQRFYLLIISICCLSSLKQLGFTCLHDFQINPIQSDPLITIHFIRAYPEIFSVFCYHQRFDSFSVIVNFSLGTLIVTRII